MAEGFNCRVIFTFAFVGLLLWSCNNRSRIEIVDSSLIYASNEHAAFSSITSFEDDTVFIAFREAKAHRPKDSLDYGRIVCIKRVEDCNVDTSIIQNPSLDLRDPFLVHTDSGLRMYCFCRKLDSNGELSIGESLYSDYRDGIWSQPEKVTYSTTSPYILWKIRKAVDKYYSVGYNDCVIPALFFSIDGIHWTEKHKITDSVAFSEGDLVCKNNNLSFIIRNESDMGDGLNVGAHSIWYDDSTEEYRFLERSISCPDLLKLDDNHILLGCRTYNYKRNKLNTISISVMLMDFEGQIIEELIIPTEKRGDKGYTSFLQTDSIIFMTYYNGTANQSNIYLSKLRINI